MNDLNYLLINYIYNYLSAFIMSTPPIHNELLNKCLQWMNECLTTPQHENRSAIGCQNKVDAWNGYEIKNKKILQKTV